MKMTDEATPLPPNEAGAAADHAVSIGEPEQKGAGR